MMAHASSRIRRAERTSGSDERRNGENQGHKGDAQRSLVVATQLGHSLNSSRASPTVTHALLRIPSAHGAPHLVRRRYLLSRCFQQGNGGTRVSVSALLGRHTLLHTTAHRSHHAYNGNSTAQRARKQRPPAQYIPQKIFNRKQRAGACFHGRVAATPAQLSRPMTHTRAQRRRGQHCAAAVARKAFTTMTNERSTAKGTPNKRATNLRVRHRDVPMSIPQTSGIEARALLKFRLRSNAARDYHAASRPVRQPE
jgi:hypothetical protein